MIMNMIIENIFYTIIKNRRKIYGMIQVFQKWEQNGMSTKQKQKSYMLLRYNNMECSNNNTVQLAFDSIVSAGRNRLELVRMFVCCCF